MKRYTREQLLFFLKKLEKELMRTPRIVDLDKAEGLPSSTTYMKRFGSWNDALKEAELGINSKKEYSRDELVQNMILLSKELGHAPSSKDFKGRKWAGSVSTYRKVFGSLSSALKEAGLEKHGAKSLASFVKKK
ncbi:MAG: hypothetical protein NDI94_04785 [Candidatus Woesearchaeota archaeon]|nr:hypothetical protein [Candidatus Woesearchaeota archaeon]